MSNQKWEYKRVTVWQSAGGQSDEQVSKFLTVEYGENGWELLSAFYQPGEGYIYFFKRSAS